MCIDYLRIELSREATEQRYANWLPRPEVLPPTECLAVDSDRIILKFGRTRSVDAVLMWEKMGWTYIRDQTGLFASRPVSEWVRFGGSQNLLVAGYCEVYRRAYVYYVHGGELTRQFVDDSSHTASSANLGRLPDEHGKPFESWTDVSVFVDFDSPSLGSNEKGFVWIHARSPGNRVTHPWDDWRCEWLSGASARPHPASPAQSG